MRESREAASSAAARASSPALYGHVTREVDAGPSGADIGAFFDVDRTLLAGFSAVEFVRHSLWNGDMSAADLFQTMATAAWFQLGKIGFSSFVTGTSTALRRLTEEEFVALGDKIFTERLAAEIFPESRALVRAHRRKGHTVALVSSATRYQIEPLARELEIPHVLCTRLEVRAGRFTGRVLQPTCYGDGKASAAREFAAANRIDLSRSHFYTDSHEDLPLLEIVGHPHPLNPTRQLAAIAARRGWPLQTFRSRGVPGATEVLRTTLAIGALIPSLFLGLPAAALDGSWRRAVNLATSVWGEVGTALAGVEVRVTGEEHLWSHRPAVFIFNHQSAIDMLLVCKLLKRDIVGIAKQEVLRNPIFGPAFALAGTVFIDRSNHALAIEAMKPAVDALREGLSIAIAPEGTRSATPRLGRFKKGAFHLAMTAGVPVVPIVFRNSLDALPKHAMIVRPTTVEAVIHPPVPTTGWTPATLDSQIAAIRELYLRTLEDS
jgi:putative phosphoserine phosphatase/1-acylglycerol-3-phosphate O-acyltransferase